MLKTESFSIKMMFAFLKRKAIGLAFELTWGVAKIVATILLAIAVPAFILLLPVAPIAGAVGLLKACG